MNFIMNIVRWISFHILKIEQNVDLTNAMTFYMAESSTWFKTIKTSNEKVSKRTISFKIMKEQKNINKFLSLIKNDLYDERTSGQKVYFYKLEGNYLKYYSGYGWLRTFYIHYYME